MKKHIVAVVVFISFVSFGQASLASPVPVTLTLTDSSAANLFISGLLGAFTSSVPIDLSGTLDVEIRDATYARFDNTVHHFTTSIALTGSDIELSDESISSNRGFLGGVEFGLINVGINQFNSNGQIDLMNLAEVDPFEYTFDPGGGVGGADLAIDQGLFTYNGTGVLGGRLGSGIVDFSLDPVGGLLGPVGQIGLVTQDVVLVGDTTTVEVAVSVPLPRVEAILTSVEYVSTFEDTVSTTQYEVLVELSGALVATGFYTAIVLPEPSTVVLLGIALVALIPLRRRMIRR